MVEEARLESILRKIDEPRNFLEEIKQNDLMSEKYKKNKYVFKLCEILAYFSFNSYWLCSISAFASLVCVPVGITSSAVGIKVCAISSGIKKSIIKKKKKKDDEIMLLGKEKLNTIEVPIFKALIDSHISHGEFVSLSNVLREYYEMKKEIKNSETSVECTI